MTTTEDNVAAADALRRRGSRLARKLLAEFLRIGDADRPIDQRLANARFGAATDVLAAEHGHTGHAWQMAVIGPFREVEAHRPMLSHGPGGNLAFLAWEADLVEAIDRELAELI